MSGILGWVESLLTPLGHPVYDTLAPARTAPPFYVLSAPPEIPVDVALAGAAVIDAPVLVTATAALPEGVRSLLASAAVRLDEAQVLTATHLVEMKFVRVELVDVDEEVTLDEGTHPAFGVSSYRLVAQPLT